MAITWIPIFCLMIAGACLAVGLIHGVVGLKRTGELAHLAFSVIAFSYAAITVSELLLIRTQSPGEFGEILRWTHVPLSVGVIATIVFVRTYFRAGRLWLAWGIVTLQVLSLILNFLLHPNIHRNPWAAVEEASLLLLAVFVADALWAVWWRGRPGDRRRAATIGGSFLLVTAAWAGASLLLQGGSVPSVFLHAIPLLAVLVVSSVELSGDVLRAARLATLLQKNEELISDERGFLRQVIDVVPNLIFAKNREGQFVLVNQAVADLYGTTVDAMIGKTSGDFNKNPQEVEAFRRADLEVLDTLKEKLNPEEKITDARGQIRWLQTVKRPILGKDGTASLMLGSATDITARRQADLEVARQRNELAHFSRLTMLGVISGSIAHELNQPLAAVLSNAQAALRLLEKNQFGEVHEILQDIVRDNKRAGEIIQGLRLLLRNGESRRRRLDLNELVRDALRLVHSDILNGGVALTTGFTPATPKVEGDQVQLQQVLLNLVVNACDAMAGNPAGDRKLHVAVEPTADSCVEVRVVDHGEGIPPGEIERVFEPFVTTKKDGLGLGLSVCRKIIQSHGGRLWAANNPGHGASFQFTLPASSGDAA